MITTSYAVLLLEKNKSKIFAPVVTPGHNENEPTPERVTGFEDDRIVGGELTSIEEFPYLVGIMIGRSHICGGTYIHHFWVLTAAHCISKYTTTILTCGMGMTFLTDKDIQLRDSVGIYPHEHYNAKNDTNDVGLIRIARPFAGSSKVSFVKLAWAQAEVPKTCKVAGWGVQREEDMLDRSKLSNQLRYTEVPIISQKRCSELYYLDVFQPHFRDTKVFCAGYEEGGHDACQGDSGGPLVCNNVQVGIVSWGIGCGNELPGVYVNVTSYIDWIEEKLYLVDLDRIRSQGSYNSTDIRQSFILLIILPYYFLIINLFADL